MADYKTVRATASGELTEKRSRFIGYCKPVSTEEEATAFIASIRSRHWDARHNVYAYSLREGNLRRYSDDGETSGAAGMGVLAGLQKGGVTEDCAVVTGYFGGVLLGTGGLVRAYSQAARLGLNAAQVGLMERCACRTLRCSYTHDVKLASLLQVHGAGLDDTVYEADVLLRFHIKPEALPGLNKALADATAGEIAVETEKEAYFPKPEKI